MKAFLTLLMACSFFLVLGCSKAKKDLERWNKTTEQQIARMENVRMQARATLPAEFTKANLESCISDAEIHLKMAPAGAITTKLESELKKTKESLADFVAGKKPAHSMGR